MALPSDDALFFVRAVRHFSVLELSPHFPGYPGFVLLARALDAVIGDAARSVFWVSALAGITLVPLVHGWVDGATSSFSGATFAALWLLLQPLLPGVTLAMLSDSLGLACLLGHLLALDRERPALAGALLGLCLAARPSYAPLALASLATLLFWKRDATLRVVLPLLGVGLACALFVLAADGMAYFTEGTRFVQGHFAIWGAPGVVQAQPSWLDTLAHATGGIVLLVFATLVSLASFAHLPLERISVRAALCMLGAYGAWMILAQNPSNARHAAPLILLGVGLTSIGIARSTRRWLPIAAACLLLATAAIVPSRITWTLEGPPLARAANALAAYPGATLITSWGVETLRDTRPDLALYDAYYSGSAELAASEATGPVLRLSSTPLGTPWRLVERFDARFPGELTLELYLRSSEGAAHSAKQ